MTKQSRRAVIVGIVVLLAAMAFGCGGSSNNGGGDSGNNAVNNDVNNVGNNDQNNDDNNDLNNDVNNDQNNDQNNDVNNDQNNAVNNEPEGPLTYYRDVRPILVARCLECHAEGGVGPFKLETPEQVTTFAEAIKTSVLNGSMPPWLPEEDCRDFKNERRMSQDEIDTLVGWLDGDRVMGDPADEPAVERVSPDLDSPDLIIKAAQPYTANPELPDDYRCLVLDHDFDQDTYISAYQIVPDKRAIVHHVLLYQVAEADIDRLEQLEAEDDTPGYRCFGGPRVGDLLGTVAGWVPGSVPIYYPENSAYIVPGGSKVVMQVHYNLLAGEAEPDQTEVQFKLLDSPPENIVKILPIPVGDLEIPADEPAAQSNGTFPNFFGKDLTVVGMAPHMHMLGKKFKANVTHIDGRGRSCIVDIEDWDFNWQQFYEFEEESFLRLGPGDLVSVSCTHDNSAANQPVVNGEQIEPRDVEWGDGSLDEMCLLYLVTMEPYDGLDICEEFEPCNQSCDPSDPFCTLSCISNGGGDCRQCGVLGAVDCAGDVCEGVDDGLFNCLIGCITEFDLGACFEERCEEDIQEVWSCLGPALYDGQCNDQLATCEISF